MGYRQATVSDILAIYNLVQETVKTIYPNYYLQEIVDFFVITIVWQRLQRMCKKDR
ncbi:MAG: hypothetical protein IJY09_05165 [Lachnospiraceae bacterium]|nr:hypothetical protein [Lachnospiraceae bacterium]